MSIDDNFLARIKNMGVLFQFVKTNKEDDLIDYLQSLTPSDFDLNLKDPQGNYLIYLVIVKGFIRALPKLIDYGATLDLLDTDGTSILHYPIKYGHDEILMMLLDASERTIGVSLVNIPDQNKRTPINYAVNYQNIFALNELIRRGADVNYTLPDGLTPLHAAVIKKNTAITRILIRKGSHLNSQKRSGITPLHIAVNLLHYDLVQILLEAGANQYIIENSYGFTPIYYAVLQSSSEIVKLCLDHGFDINFTDQIGNGIIYYSLVKKDHPMIDYYFTTFDVSKMKRIDVRSIKTINANQTNVKGETLTHVFLDNYEEAYESHLIRLLDKTDLGLQDDQGETVLHQIARYNRWSLFETVLRKKKLGIYVLNLKNETPYSLTLASSRDYLIDLVIDSYFEYLRLKPERAVNWELKCLGTASKNIPDYCREKAREMILDKKLPYPIAPNILDPYYDVTFTTFHSKTLDVLSGFSYILSKHPTTTLIAIAGDQNPPELESYYKMLGLVTDPYNSYVQFEIKWIFQKLFLPYRFKENLVATVRNLTSQTGVRDLTSQTGVRDLTSQTGVRDHTSRADIRYLIAPIGIKLQSGSHSNGLIIDLQGLDQDQITIERFEPHGSGFPREFNYNPDLLDNMLAKRIGNIIVEAVSKPIKIFYVAPKDYLPKISFQAIESSEENNESIGDPGGFCAIWTIWYLDHRVRYTDLSQLARQRQNGGAKTQEDAIKLPAKVVQRLIDAIRISQVPFRSTIRSYSKAITDYRDQFLNEYHYNINDYINKKIPLSTLHTIASKMIPKS